MLVLAQLKLRRVQMNFSQQKRLNLPSMTSVAKRDEIPRQIQFLEQSFAWFNV